MFYTTIDQTSLLTQFQDMTAYNLWAITRLTDWLKSKPALLMEATAASSFPGIKATLLHILEVEREWLGNLQQQPVRFQEYADENVGNVLARLASQAADLNDYVQGLTDEGLQKDCYCNLLFGGEICRPRFEIIQHCLNHSTYHRGQVVTIGHQVGLKDAPITDYMFYLLKVKPKRSGNLTATASQGRQSGGSFSHKSLLAVNFFSKVAS
jgi:uncharacterized damage-inducible protein DinB